MELGEKNKLLLARAGFGISVENFHNQTPITRLVNDLFPVDAPEKLSVVTAEEWETEKPSVVKEKKLAGDTTGIQQMRQAFREKTKTLNLTWTNFMVATQYPLLEKTALFWHGHFATRVENPYYEQELLHIIRTNALGSFRTMLKDVSKNPAMLQFLNNQQNKKQHPNENFAREVMELFTLGRGHYTENDIKEAARAFTGWAIDGDGAFVFRPRQHDDGQKTFLGQTGNFNGDDILDILLAQKQTSVFITQKIYRYFVSDELIDPKRIKELSATFFDSDYNIGLLLKNIFTADWFYTRQVVAGKVKSPVELLVGYRRMIPLTFTDERTMLQLQRILGQFLFNPPNVAGWPGGRNWIDSSSLVIRMRLPEALLGDKALDLSPKETDADTKEMSQSSNSEKGKYFRIGKAVADWSGFLAAWKNVSKDDIPRALTSYLLPSAITDMQLKEVCSFADKDSDEEYVKSLTILLMELPEYQLA
jgi:uncharacterized protein (DUF1800 family)